MTLLCPQFSMLLKCQQSRRVTHSIFAFFLFQASIFQLDMASQAGENVKTGTWILQAYGDEDSVMDAPHAWLVKSTTQEDDQRSSAAAKDNPLITAPEIPT